MNKLAVDGADIGVVDVAVNEVGDFAICMTASSLMSRLHQIVKRRIVVEDGRFFRTRTERIAPSLVQVDWRSRIPFNALVNLNRGLDQQSAQYPQPSLDSPQSTQQDRQR